MHDQSNALTALEHSLDSDSDKVPSICDADVDADIDFGNMVDSRSGYLFASHSGS